MYPFTANRNPQVEVQVAVQASGEAGVEHLIWMSYKPIFSAGVWLCELTCSSQDRVCLCSGQLSTCSQILPASRRQKPLAKANYVRSIPPVSRLTQDTNTLAVQPAAGNVLTAAGSSRVEQ